MRTLEKVELPAFNVRPGAKNRLEWIAIDRLVVDDRYQRDTGGHGAALVKRIAGQFRWSKFSPVIVAPVAGDRYAVIDGQHRARAALSLGLDIVPCSVVDAKHQEAAEIFAAVNGNVIRMSVLALFKAALAAGVQWAVDVDEVCRANGIEPLSYPVPAQKLKPYSTMSIGKLRQIVERHGRDVLTAMVRIMKVLPNSEIPGFINSARITETLQTFTSHAGWNRTPLAISDQIVADLTRNRPVSVQAEIVAPANKVKEVTDRLAAYGTIQELKAKGFTQGMVASVIKFRRSVIADLWNATEGAE